MAIKNVRIENGQVRGEINGEDILLSGAIDSKTYEKIPANDKFLEKELKRWKNWK